MRQQSAKIEVVNVRFPNHIVTLLDTLIDKGIYKSRSEAIRDFCRKYIVEKK